jgi:hypothetical protein
MEIATASGARVIQRRFDGYAHQRNAALNDVEYKYPWVLMVDADERWPLEIANEMIALLRSSPPNLGIVHFRRKDMFLGRWLRRSTGYPTWFGRLVKRGHVEVRREINEEYHTDGSKAYAESHFIHYPFNKGINYWFERHNRYSTMEARTLVEETRGRLDVKGLGSRDPIRRRKALKQLAYRMPFRPILAFAYLYLWRMGFLDGRPGFIYCTLRSIYEYMIDLKVKELRRREQSLPI